MSGCGERLAAKQATCRRQRPTRYRSRRLERQTRALGTVPGRSLATVAACSCARALGPTLVTERVSAFPSSVTSVGPSALTHLGQEKGASRAPFPGINNLPDDVGGAGGVRPRPPGKFQWFHVAGVAGGVHPKATATKPQDDLRLPPMLQCDKRSLINQCLSNLHAQAAAMDGSASWNCSMLQSTNARTSGRAKSSRRATR